MELSSLKKESIWHMVWTSQDSEVVGHLYLETGGVGGEWAKGKRLGMGSLSWKSPTDLPLHFLERKQPPPISVLPLTSKAQSSVWLWHQQPEWFQ